MTAGIWPRFDNYQEIVLVGLVFHHEHDIISIALENREYRSEESQRFCIDKVIKDVDIDSIDSLVIPSGEPDPLVNNLELKIFVENLVLQRYFPFFASARLSK